MSPDPYPEVSGDESGIVPPQSSTRSSEWPKKLRTLTAAELDRLTIDNTGRFYWDGKLVNYDTQSKQLTSKSSNSFDRSMDMLDRAGSEFGGNKSPATIEGELSRLDTLSREIACERTRHTAAASGRDQPGHARRQRNRRAPPDAVGLADRRRGHCGRLHRGRRVRHGHLWLRRGSRMGLQDRRIPERLPGDKSRTAGPGGYPGLGAAPRLRSGSSCPPEAASAALARFDFRLWAGKHDAR